MIDICETDSSMTYYEQIFLTFQHIHRYLIFQHRLQIGQNFLVILSPTVSTRYVTTWNFAFLILCNNDVVFY